MGALPDGYQAFAKVYRQLAEAADSRPMKSINVKTNVTSIVAALAFTFVAEASAQDSAGKTDWPKGVVRRGCQADGTAIEPGPRQERHGNRRKRDRVLVVPWRLRESIFSPRVIAAKIGAVPKGLAIGSSAPTGAAMSAS